MGEKLPILKVPSAKIVIKPLSDNHLDYKQIEKSAKEISEYVDVAYGDYDLYLPMEIRTTDRMAYKSVTIQFYCKYEELQSNVNAVKERMRELIENVEILVKPSYLQQYTSCLLNKIE